MKKILFGISLILFSILIVLLETRYVLPGVVQYIYAFSPLVGIVFCFIGLFEKNE